MATFADFGRALQCRPPVYPQLLKAPDSLLPPSSSGDGPDGPTETNDQPHTAGPSARGHGPGPLHHPDGSVRSGDDAVLLRPVDVSSDGLFATPTADGDGLFEASFDLPDDVGRRLLVACQLCGSSDERRVEQRFRIVAFLGAPTLRVDPERAASGADVHLIGTGFGPDLGAVTFSVESGGAVIPMSATALVGPDGGFDVTVGLPGVAVGTYLIRACQRCSEPDPPEATSALTVVAAPPPWPWVAGAIAVVALAAGSMLLRRRLRRPRDQGSRDGSGEVVHAHARPSIPVVTAEAEPGAGPGHTIRLVPHPDPGTQRVEEMIDR